MGILELSVLSLQLFCRAKIVSKLKVKKLPAYWCLSQSKDIRYFKVSLEHISSEKSPSASYSLSRKER